MKFKYILFMVPGFTTPQPVLFFDGLTHLDMYNDASDRLPRGTHLYSAGFFTMQGGKPVCYGESESLKTAGKASYKSRRDDEQFIAGAGTVSLAGAPGGSCELECVVKLSATIDKFGREETGTVLKKISESLLFKGR